MNRTLATTLESRGMSTYDLARLTGLSQPTCWRAVKGVGRTLYRNRLLIAGALGESADHLFATDNQS
jgi:transcriptional regulator with XRE-family HTH domain